MLEHPTPTMPHSETQMLIHGLQQFNSPDGFMSHLCAAQPTSRPPPTLLYPKWKKAKKQGHEEALCDYFESVIERYQKEGWCIIYLDRSSERHP